jgi:hypothetical protein
MAAWQISQFGLWLHYQRSMEAEGWKKERCEGDREITTIKNVKPMT